jgi:hypothetical protein
MNEILKKNYCTADKIASDPNCYEWAKAHPESMARHYFCQQQYQDPLCTGAEAFNSGKEAFFSELSNSGKIAEKIEFPWLMLLIFIVLMSLVFVVLNILKKGRGNVKYYGSCM